MRKLLMAGVLALALAGCGGGGGGGGVPVLPPGGGTETPPLVEDFVAPTGTYAGTVNFDAAYGDTLRGSRHEAFRTAPGSTELQVFTLTHGWRPEVVFRGGAQARIGWTIFAGGGYPAIVHSDHYVTLDPVRVMAINDFDDEFSAVTMAGALPTAGRVGDSGSFYSYVRYSDSTQSRVVGTGTVTWSIEADTAGSAFACLKDVETEQGATTAATMVLCYQVDGATQRTTGRVRVKFSDDGTTIVFNKRDH